MKNPLSPLLLELADLYQAEGRKAGERVADALRTKAAEDHVFAIQEEPPLNTALETLLSNSDMTLLPALNAAMPYLNWVYSSLEGRIREDIALGMIQVELIGPDGMFFSTDFRVGLWFQSPDLNYVTRSHAAEECFQILAGHAFWSTNDGPATRCGAGEAVHHPSYMPHSNRTDATGILAAWRWSGDIAIEQYALKG